MITKTNTEPLAKFDPQLIDELLAGQATPQAIQGLIESFTKTVLERALQGELTHHLGYEKHAKEKTGNQRNGTSRKTLKTKQGALEIAIPRDRQATFEPQLIAKHQTRWEGFDDLILSLYSRGLTTREIQSHLQEIYGIEVAPDFISTVTEAVADAVKAWRNRPLEAVYPVVWFDALMVKIRHQNQVQNRAVYLALALNLQGHKEVLGLWSNEAEGAKFWLQIATDLHARGVQDILISCVDGLKGLPEALTSVFPKTQVQLCLVHLVRYSLQFVGYKERKGVATDLKAIYHAPTEEAAQLALQDFAAKWEAKYPLIVKSWRANWERITPMFGYPAALRKIVYTTNAIESLNMSLRKIIKNRAAFPSEEAAYKLLYLALQNIEKKWTMPILDWARVLNQLAILFEGRLPQQAILLPQNF
jgi:putative transposase